MHLACTSARRRVMPSADKGADFLDAEAAQRRDALDWADLSMREPPPRKWAIKGWFGFGHTTLLVGQGGIGKTLIAQQIGSCLAVGKAFIDEATPASKVLMWACEDDHDELWRRQIAISRWMRMGLDEYAGNLQIIPRHGLDNALVSTEYGRLISTPTLGLLKQQAHDEKAEIVILDNVAQLYGGSENDRHSVTSFLNWLAGALEGMAVLLLAHPSRGAASEFSGSSAWENVARTRLYLGATLPDQKAEEEPSAEVRYLSRRKSNYSNKDYRRCQYKDGVLIPDQVMAEGGIISTLRASKAERVVLSGVAKLADMGIYGSDAYNSPRYLPRAIGEYKLNDGLTKTEMGEAMRRLMLDGRLAKSEVAKDGRRNPVLGIVAKPTETPF